MNTVVNSPDVDPGVLSIQDPLGNAIHTVFAADCVANRVAVFGLGPVGVLAVAVLKAIGAAARGKVEEFFREANLTEAQRQRLREEMERRVGEVFQTTADVVNGDVTADQAYEVLDAVATDHAPHALHEKDVDFIEAPPGLIGFETAVAVVLDLVRQNEISPLELVRRLSTSPARILNRPGGELSVGSPGDVTVVDPERRWTYDPAKGYSKSRNSPWAGKALEGRVVATIVDGRLVYQVDRGVLVP